MKVHKVGIIRGGGRICALSATFLLAMTASAKLKYWTTGGYDADSYVQDGLVLNYDGIRNVGLDQPHSKTTTTWVNLGSAGSAYDVERQDTNATGAWTENAFKAAAKSYFRTKSDFVFPVTRTMQACFIPTATTHAYIFSPVGDDLWQRGSFQLPGTGKLNFNAHYYKYEDSNVGIPWSAAARPETACANSTFNTATAFLTSDYATITLGTTRPTSGNRSSGYVSLAGGQRSVTQFSAKANIMGNNGTTQLFNGTLFAFRFYNRILDNNELVWNRAVDQTRFFGAKPLSVIPTTNAVIASSIAIVAANEAAGAYAVDASGHIFTAPASQTVDGRAYTCTGYKLETWDDATGTWGNAQTESGTSVFVTASDRVRITWQWMDGDGIVTRYTTADYVQDGLILHYDGIRNVGVDQPHSYDTTQWKNLAPNGGYDLTFRAQTGCTKPGEWRDDGYRFEQQSTFANTASIDLPANQTIQIALNANALDQYALNKSGVYINEPYLYYAQTTFGKGASISLRKDIEPDASKVSSTHFDWTVQAYGDSTTRPRPKMTIGAPAKYVTAILADGYGAAMTGTTIPSAQTNQGVMDASRRDFTKGPPEVITANTGFGIGGNYSDGQGKFKGTIHNFRFYNRVLTNEELAKNRKIDDYRFHGIMPVTNVVVSSSHSFLSGNEKSGNYEISGSYTFTAPSGTQTDARGFEYELEGYTIETWDAAALGWSAPVAQTGSSYTWTDGVSPAKVRLTWQWKTTKALRTAADYGLEDIVPAGLALHFDGINNLGAECATTLNPTSRLSQAWVNLADEGEFTLGRVDKATPAGAWTTDGFAFTNESASVGSYFKYTGALTLTPSYTWQFLLDAKVADQPNETCGYIMFNDNWTQSSLGIRTKSDYKYGLYYVPDTAFPGESTAYRPKILDTQTAKSKYTWATAILDGNDAMLFAGTTYPTDSVGKKTAPNAATAQTLKAIGIGGCNAGNGWQDFTGKVKSVRYYDRVLTEAELLRNREVDSARYFGVLATTNVVVGTEAYKVEGSYEFKAEPATVEVDGVTKDVAGYRLYVLKNGTEVRLPWHRGTTFTYPDDLPADLKAARATVRLEWEAEPPGLMILIR